MDIIGIKPDPGDHEPNFKKVGAIPINETVLSIIGLDIHLVPNYCQ